MSDETEEVSSETPSETPVAESVPESQPESDGAEEKEVSSAEPQEEKPTPFHEHPRFKELIEQNRSMKEQTEAFKQQSERQREEFIRLQTQMEALREANRPKPEPVKDPFLADLEKVNPEYAKSLKAIYDQASLAKQLEQRLAQFEQANFAEKAISHFNKLLDDRKVTDPMDRKILERGVRAEVYDRESRGQKLNLKDLEKITSDFYTEYKTTMDARERAITAKYVQQKTTDKTPKGATGGIAKNSQAKKLKANDIQGQAKWMADQIRAMKKEH